MNRVLSFVTGGSTLNAVLRGVVCVLAVDSVCLAARQTIVLGGPDGLSWESGGGEVTAVVQTRARELHVGNTPGNVIDFERTAGWIFPQRADESLNIALGIIDRGGSLKAPTVRTADVESQLAWMIDDDGETAFARKNTPGGARVNSLGVIMDFDLGARFGVYRIRFFPRNAHPQFSAPEFPFQNDFLRAYELFLNDGSEQTQNGGRPVLTTFKLEPQNDVSVVEVDIPPQYVRHIRLKSQTTIGFEVAEFQVFGTGFVPVAEYVSNLFDLGPDLAMFGAIRWLEEATGAQQLSQVRISSRTGHDDSPLVFHRIDQDSGLELPWRESAVVTVDDGSTVDLDNDLAPADALSLWSGLSLSEKSRAGLTAEDYDRLSQTRRGAIEEDLVAWSPWSPPYGPAAVAVTSETIGNDDLGTPIVSPGPRRYLQLRIEFLSDDLEAATGVGPVSFTYSTPPVAQSLLAEIYPRQAAQGETLTFTYAVMPTRIRPGIDTGFDTFDISTPVRASRVESIEIAHADGASESADFSNADLDNLPTSDETGRFTVEEITDRRLRLRFPPVESGDIAADRASVLKIRFSCRVLRYGTTFSGTAWNSQTDNLGQPVLAGNVGVLAEDDDDPIGLGRELPRALSVDVPISGDRGRLLANVRAAPATFTPNGDGVNDATAIAYDLTGMAFPAPVEVHVFTVAGHVVRRLTADNQSGGAYAVEWDGTDAAGRTVPPGIYLFRVRLDSDSRDEAVFVAVAVAY